MALWSCIVLSKEEAVDFKLFISCRKASAELFADDALSLWLWAVILKLFAALLEEEAANLEVRVLVSSVSTNPLIEATTICAPDTDTL